MMAKSRLLDRLENKAQKESMSNSIISTYDTSWGGRAQLSAVIAARGRLWGLPSLIPVPLKVLIPAGQPHRFACEACLQ